MKFALVLGFGLVSAGAHALDGAKQVAILTWLRPLMGNHMLSGDYNCSRIRIWNAETRWDRFAQIGLQVGPVTDTIYHPSRHPDDNCTLAEKDGRSELHCRFLSQSGLLGLMKTTSDITLTKRGSTLEALQFERTSNVPLQNFSAVCANK